MMFLQHLLLLSHVMISTCQNDSNPQLLYSNINEIEIIDTDTGVKTTIASNINRAISVDFHVTKGYIYWSDVTDRTISRIKYQSSNNGTVEVIITEDIMTPDGIAIDSVNDHLYWTDTGIDKVMRSNLDGSVRTVILDTDLQEPRAIVLDTSNSLMYLSDWGTTPKIEKCKFDGTSRQTIVSDDLMWPNALAIDFNDQRIYWVDGGLKQIKSSNLDGSNKQLILKSSEWLPHPFDMDVYGSYIYYSDWSLYGIFKVSKLANSTPVAITNEVLSPMGMKIYSSNVDFPSDVFSIHVEASREEGSVITEFLGQSSPNLEPVFKCSFVDVVGKTYFYSIYWYINENSVKTFENVIFQDIDSTWLRPEHWVQNYKMNMYVKCSVRARKSVDGTPSPHQYSANFIAGVIPDNYIYEVSEGSNVTFTVSSTVPIGCTSILLINNCKETFKIGYPSYTKNSDACDGSIDNGDLAFERETCGVEIPANNWNKINDIVVYGYVDSVYNTESVRTTNIRLTHQLSRKDPSHAWDNVIIPNIQIRIKDEDINIELAKCETWSDPRYYTFDRTYFSKSISGEYVLYRHKRNPYWVHTLSTACWDGTCNVGVAIRSHNSLFVVRTSDVVSHNVVVQGRVHPFVNFRHCDDQNMVVKRHGTQYTVILPTGTEIWFKIGKGILGFPGYWVWHVTIKPSALDIEQTEGLCGFLSRDGSKNDDFLERDTGHVVDESTFIKSWNIEEDSTESLFTADPGFLSDEYLQPFCVCKEVLSDSSSFQNFNKVDCNLTQPLEGCYNTTTDLDTSFYSSCSPARKKRDVIFSEDRQTRKVKRSIEDSDDITEETILRYASDFVPKFFRPEPEWTDGWTEEKARIACTTGFDDNVQLSKCKEYVYLFTEEYVTSCIEDIKASGNTTLMMMTVDKMLSSCVIEISRNESLRNSSESGSRESLSEAITSELCQNDCSGHGTCEKGICKCTNGFTGLDCSFFNNLPPSGITLPDAGRCGTRTRQCSKTNVYGDFDTEDIWFKRRHFQIIDNQNRSSGIIETLKAEYRNPYMVTCQLASSGIKRDLSNTVMAEGYYLSFSLDGSTFGEEVTIIIYDENCYSCNAITVSCSILDSCQTDTATKINSDGRTIGLIIGLVLAGVILLVILIIGIKFYKYKNNRQKPQYEENTDETNTDLDDELNVCNIPPVINTLPVYDHLHREKTTATQLKDEVEKRPKTPFELFLVEKNVHN
ncbi:von Willebrand factor D and EGF domain-containing protein-like [Mytilus galloprovincialis]|uniref:von Willebrand factor D and EGF domain-containing protein-like n=1 Tax=Mytilus galloprovincialis TaxID=29158 RepID=UPI003F7B9118